MEKKKKRASVLLLARGSKAYFAHFASSKAYFALSDEAYAAFSADYTAFLKEDSLAQDAWCRLRDASQNMPLPTTVQGDGLKVLDVESATAACVAAGYTGKTLEDVMLCLHNRVEEANELRKERRSIW